MSCGAQPAFDPTDLLDVLRASALSQLLVAATTRFDVGSALEAGPLSYADLCSNLQLKQRPATVLLTGVRSLGLIDVDELGQVLLTDIGREKITASSRFNLRGYIGLGALSSDAQNMITCLENDRPTGEISFVYHADGTESALDDQAISDALTRAMAARAQNVAPHVAAALELGRCKHLLDVGGGHGIYTLELLKRFPQLTATIIDRAPPLIVAQEYAELAGLSDRVDFQLADIHNYVCSTEVDAVLMANILHDYDYRDAEKLVIHFARQLSHGGQMIVLDAFLDSVPAGKPPISRGPRAVAAYSAMLFTICEGRCYRTDEFQQMYRAASLDLEDNIASVPAHGKLLIGKRGAS
ncbi:MAG: methyltransferase domain-containing protein [Planctomycetales bacterium]|nr:methyltransferase domain-containing protein [Planctomycetales bacterium]